MASPDDFHGGRLKTGWYLARLKAMSAGELLHRVGQTLRRTGRRFDQGASGVRPPMPKGPGPTLRFFDVTLQLPGEVIDWSRDYRSGRAAALAFYGDVDYRDAAQVGDSKYTWELNRHQFLVPWALEFRETKREGLAEWVAYIILDWIAANPRHRGLNWGSALEHALRILSWGLALDLCRDSPAIAASRPKLIRSVSEQARFIRCTLSEHSSANNHLMGELVGLLAAGALFPELPGARQLAAYARERLVQECLRQTFADGVCREQAVYYHHYVSEYLLTAGALCARLAMPLPESVRTRTRRMLEFVDAVTDDAGAAFEIGDRDEGSVTGLNLETGVGVYESLLWSGWTAFGDTRLGAHAARIAASRGAVPEADPRTRYWLGEASTPPPTLSSVSGRSVFPEGGYFVGEDEGCTILLRAGPFGYPAIAAHAHCDQLSILLKRGNRTILTDAGTGVYHTEDRWRRFFKGTSGHNTVGVDGADQAEYAGPFLWATHANGRLALRRDEPGHYLVDASHDGYRRLPDPVLHERSLEYRRGLGYRVMDRLHGHAPHRYHLYWNFGRDVSLEPLVADAELSAWAARLDGAPVMVLAIRGQATVAVRRGDARLPAGFESSHYLEWHPVDSLCAEASAAAWQVTTFLLPGGPGSVAELHGALEAWD